MKDLLNDISITLQMYTTKDSSDSAVYTGVPYQGKESNEWNNDANFIFEAPVQQRAARRSIVCFISVRMMSDADKGTFYFEKSQIIDTFVISKSKRKTTESRYENTENR